MIRSVLEKYSDALARTRILRQSIEKLELNIKKMEEQGYYVADSVTKGRKGKKPLGRAVVKGFPLPEYERLKEGLQKRKDMLAREELTLMELTAEVEEYIFKLEDIEIRNILTLYYIDDLNWVQTAHRMNSIYDGRRVYTDSSCRQKHDRFLEKR